MIVDCLSCMDDHDEPAHCMACDAELAGHDWPLCAACMDHEVANRTAFALIEGLDLPPAWGWDA